MKPKEKYLVIAMILLCYSFVFGQFNTLTRKENKLPEFSVAKHNVQKEKPYVEKIKDNKKFLYKLFAAPTKADLKKEIDSLRVLMLKYSLSKADHETLVPKTKNDSLQTLNNEQMSEQMASKRIPVKRSSFIIGEDFESKISMPLDKRIVITSPFGWRTHPIFRTAKIHTGTDLKANYENVYAVLDGVVAESGYSKGGGNFIKIRHSNSFVTSYLHLSEVYYKAGEFVKAGFIIAQSGNSGNSTGPHLHFAVQENGKYINPIKFLNDLINANNLIATYYETAKNSYSQQ